MTPSRRQLVLVLVEENRCMLNYNKQLFCVKDAPFILVCVRHFDDITVFDSTECLFFR